MNERPREVRARVVVTVLAEYDGCLLLAQLARGPFAGFWLLPSMTLTGPGVEAAARNLLPERTGYPVEELDLLGVVEEARDGVPVLRFVFHAGVGEQLDAPADQDIRTTRWFTCEEARAVLAERDVVPTLGVMSVIRAWAEGLSFRPLESLAEDALCPCGSGFRFKGCCGWDA